MTKTCAAALSILLAGAAGSALAQTPPPGGTPPVEATDPATLPDPLGEDAAEATPAPAAEPVERRTTTTTTRRTTEADAGEAEGGGESAPARAEDDAGAGADGGDEAAARDAGGDEGFDDWGLLGLLGLAGLLGLRRRDDDRYDRGTTVRTTDTGVGPSGLR